MTARRQGRSIGFVLISWEPDAPAGMERATIAAAHGLTQHGHRAAIITAAPDQPSHHADVAIRTLTSIDLTFPSNDTAVREHILTRAADITAELTQLTRDHDIDTLVYVDALWGLGRLMPPQKAPYRRVLAAHVIGHDTDLKAALQRHPDTVIAPSPIPIRTATARGYDTQRWHVVPNGLLITPDEGTPANRERLRTKGPIRILARLGPEKGIEPLLHAIPTPLRRATEIALATAGFEAETGSQSDLLGVCEHLIRTTPGMTVQPGLAWSDVPSWLAEAAVVIVPSLRETFGLIALEAMAGGTPVVAYDVDNLPALIGDAGVLVPADHGPAGLWRAAFDLLKDPVTYEATSRAGYYHSRDYRPAHIADQLLKVVS